MTNKIHLPPSLEPHEYLAAIIASSDDAIVSKDLKGNITSWNPGAERIFGYSLEEAVGRHISMLIPPDLLSEEDYILSEVSAGRSVRHFETKRRRKDGQLIDISVTVSPIRSPDGAIIGASKVARDITERQQSQKTSAHLGAIIASSDDAIISKDLNGFITSWNPAAERIFGYSPEEMVGKHISLLIPPGRLAEEDKILTTLRTGERVDHFETIRRHKSGRLIPVSLTISPIKDHNGKIVGASKISRDISERVRTQEQLAETNRKKDEFLANMSHELRTPMNAVIGLASILKEMPGLPDQAIKYIDILKFSADNLLDLINDLLDFAKIEADALTIDVVPFNLRDQLEKISGIVSVKAIEKGLSYAPIFGLQTDMVVLGDPLRLHQVLVNLLANAIKFSDTGSVRFFAEGIVRDGLLHMEFRVEDTGIGIPQDKLEAIFEKFTQVDSSLTRRYGGSGIGLSIVKALTEKMGGVIEVSSEMNVGSVFTLRLPFKMQESQKDISAETAQRPAKNVLLVEDYEPSITVASAILDSLDLSFDVARNGIEALKSFTYADYDIVLMDVQMQVLDGLQTTKRLRTLEKEKGAERTTVIALTAHVRDSDKQSCLDAGMDDFIAKPYTPELLSEKLREYLPKR